MQCFDWNGLESLSFEHTPRPVRTVALGYGETNGVAIHPVENLLIAAGGDNKAYVYDYEHGTVVTTLDGHEDYLHDVVLDKNTNSLVATVCIPVGRARAKQRFL